MLLVSRFTTTRVNSWVGPDGDPGDPEWVIRIPRSVAAARTSDTEPETTSTSSSGSQRNRSPLR